MYEVFSVNPALGAGIVLFYFVVWNKMKHNIGQVIFIWFSCKMFVKEILKKMM